MTPNTQNKKTNRKIFIIGGIVALVMFGFSFAMVPLYSLICKQTGINTSAADGDLLKASSAEVSSKDIDLTRNIEVQFVAVNHNGLPWDFYPMTKSIIVHPGQNNKVFFYAKNTTTHDMTVQAIPSMTPTDAIEHFHKIQCFCFTQQSLKGLASKEMPLIFRVGKNLPKDIHVITLAYTLFDAKPTRKVS
jgi:cytochrome c oxidase assembly protein subunit 11